MKDTIQEVSTDNEQLQSDNKNVIIDINNLEVTFGTVSILKGVTLKLYEGENLVILGKSGSGKSVLIKCIVSLLNSTGGSIEVFGENINKLDRHGLSEMRKKIGFLFQSGALYDSMTVKQNLEFVLKRIKRKLKQKEIDEQIIEVLENVGLANSIDKMPSELSGGMRKRISLARTIIVNPLIMLYDEPTTGLDPLTSDEISALINKVQEKYKTSSMIITHDINCVRETADRILMLQDGVIYMEGNLKDYETSRDPLIQAFFK